MKICKNEAYENLRVGEYELNKILRVITKDVDFYIAHDCKIPERLSDFHKEAYLLSEKIERKNRELREEN